MEEAIKVDGVEKMSRVFVGRRHKMEDLFLCM